MPRRAAPSALRLWTGPTPGRGEARHTLPAPPQPIFRPKTITKPRSDSLTSAAQHNCSAPALPVPGFMGGDSGEKNAVDDAMFEPTHRREYVPQWSSLTGSAVPRKTNPGPWDRSRSNTLSEEQVAQLVALPKPVVANVAPIW